MGKSVITSIRVDEDVLREAKELGLNVSKISENALKEAIRRLKGENSQNILNSQLSDDFSSEKNVVTGPPGFEPGISGLEGRRAFWSFSVQAAPRTHC